MNREVPNVAFTHNTILTADEKMIITVRSGNVSFSKGRTSTPFEEHKGPKDIICMKLQNED
jgi:hypothetical protein